MSTLYDTDPHAWADEQIKALQRLAELHPELVGELDVPHLLEELDDMKKSVEREIESRLTVILLHLAKWRWQPSMRTRSWTNSIDAQRVRLAVRLRRNPGARPALPQALEDAWYVARADAERETGLALSTFPEECPFTLDQALQRGWLPD